MSAHIAVNAPKEKPDPCGSGLVCRRGGRQSPSRGEQLPTWRSRSGRMGDRSPPVTLYCTTAVSSDNTKSRMPAMRRSAIKSTNETVDSRYATRDGMAVGAIVEESGVPRSKMPALRLGDQEVAEHLHARDRSSALPDRRNRRRARPCRLRRTAAPGRRSPRPDSPAACAMPMPRWHGALHAEDVVDGEERRARVLAVAADLGQPVAGSADSGGTVPPSRRMRCLSRSVERARRAEALEIFGRGVGVEVHREQLALDQVGLRRLAQPDRDVGLAHGEVELVVGQDQRDADVGIEIEELAQPRRQPVRADARAWSSPCRSPFGRSRLSVSLARAASSFMNTSCAVR